MGFVELPQAVTPENKALEKLDTRQAAKMINLQWPVFLDMWKKGHITDKYVRKDPDTGQWYVNRCDIPDLAEEARAHLPGSVKIVLEGSKRFTVEEIGALKGWTASRVYQALRRRNIEPVGKRHGAYLYDESAIEQMTAKPAKHSLLRDGVTIFDIADHLKISCGAVHARRYLGNWPSGFKPIGKMGRLKLYSRDILAAFDAMAEKKKPQKAENMADVSTAYLAKPLSSQTIPSQVIPSVASSPVYFDLAMELRNAGFEPAAIWMVKNKC